MNASRRPVSVAAHLGAVGVLMGSCLGDPAGASMSIHNESAVEVEIVASSGYVYATLAARDGVGAVSLGGADDSCEDRRLTARHPGGVIVGTFGPPVCGGDVWTITQKDVDEALDDAAE